MPLATPSAIRVPPRGGARRLEWLVIGLLTGLCLALPTHNSTPDAWYYAACVRHGHELAQPHHLLYSVAGGLWLRLLPGTPDALAALKALNALAYGGALLVLRDLLRRVGGPAAPVAGWLLVVGSSFGMLRFATENETYMLPLLLSLLASRSWWRARATGAAGRWLVAGTWAAGAALLHQIHAGWWLGLLAGTAASTLPGAAGMARWRLVLLYGLPALLVPLAYAAALPGWGLPFTPAAYWHFVFRDLYAGQAGAAPSGHTLLLTSISLLRTFGQVHGSGLALLRRWPWAVGGLALLSAGLLVLAGRLGWAARRRAAPTVLVPAPTAQPEVATPGLSAFQADKQPADGRLFWRTHLLILGLQLACAIWAEGNAEFMVMVPALLALLLVSRSIPDPAPGWVLGPALPWVGASLLVWNLTFGLLPAYALRFSNPAPLLARLRRQPAAWWLLRDPNLVLNQLHYRTGQALGPAQVLPAPVLLMRRLGQSPARFRAWLAGRRAAGQPVYTDALGGPQLLDRARLTQGSDDAQFALLAGYHLVRVDSFPTSFGPVYLTEIR